MTNVAETTVDQNETEQLPNVPAIPSIKVTRNDVELEYTEMELKKGPKKGWKFPAVKVGENNLNAVIGYISQKKILNKIQSFFSQLSKGWWEEAICEATDKVTGQVDLEKALEVFKQLAVDFSSRGESIPEIKDRIEDLVEELTNLDPTSDNWAEEFKSKSAEIKDLRKALDEKRRPKKPTNDVGE